MHRVLAIALVCCVAGAAGLAGAADVFFPRHPGISPDGATVVFGFQGDLWAVDADGGTARRLTAHEAYDGDPIFSPDGRQLAFASDREGSADVWVMPAGGGLPARLTYASTSDRPEAWTTDGAKVLFASARPWRYPVRSQIQHVPATGGTPFRLLDTFAEEIAVHPDGQRHLIAVGSQRFGRVGYRGTYQSDLWLLEPGRDPVQMTDFPGYDTDPMWGPGGETIYWRAEDDETGAFNLWRMNADGTGKERLTDFRHEGVRNAQISRDGSRIVCEAGTGLWVLDTTPDAEIRELAVSVAPDLIENPVTVKDFTKDADELSVAAGGDELAMIVAGEVVLVNQELEGRATVPVPAPWRESSVAFRPGSADTVLVVSDREVHDGTHYSRVGLVVSADPDTALLRAARHHRIEWLTPAGVEATRPQWSPDGRRIAYLQGNGELVVMAADGGDRRTVRDGWDAPEFTWSPDSRWLACSYASGPDFNQDVWLHPVAGGEPVNVSQHPDVDGRAVWSEDGSILAWPTRRWGNQFDVAYVYLRRADHERTEEEWKVWEKTRDETGQQKGKSGKKAADGEDAENGEEETTAVEPIRIDTEDIHLRVRRATDLPGDEFVVAVHPRGDRIAFTADVGGERDLFTVDRFGEDRQALTEGGARPTAALLAADGETVWFLKDGRPAHVPLAGGKVETASFRARLTIDRPAIRQQVVEEAWRGLRDRFYDPQMHGLDWEQHLEKARELAAGCFTDADFADVMNIMLRALNASHMGYYPGGRGGGDRTQDFLGIVLDPAHRGEGLRVASGVPHGPADQELTRLLAGDVILAVDGQPVGARDNLWAPLAAAGGDPVLVTVERGDDEIELQLEPVGWRELRQRIYDADIRANRERVEAESDGRVGYVHIQGMGQREVEIFERDLYAAASGKQALIIDVRDNGGGWTTDMLLTILTQPVHAYTIPRDGEVGYPDAERLPLQKWHRPVAVICNEGSYSNAEIFSHAIKTIGRGPVVGMTTGGNVISTGGWRTLDGGWVRLPFRGWYVWGDERHPERNDRNQEHGGCVPDHLVPMGPPEWLAGLDPQLDRAVALMAAAADAAQDAPRPRPRRAAAARE